MSGIDGPVPAAADQPRELPFADDLLSERSKAWVKNQLEGQEDPPLGRESGESGVRPNIAGYIVGRRIGRGGMGTVYECHCQGSEQRLAIKIMSSGKYAAVEERRRFMVEIGALLRLHHPHLSRLRDFGQDGSVAWFVMDYIDGRSLHVWRAEEKPSWIRIADLLGQSARAMAHAHRQGIIHRDLNPANIMVQPDGTPIVMDFGLARDLSSDEVLTVSGSTVGTPPYMSPEQTRGSKAVLDVRTDVWGMGAVLYHALTGRAPFQAPSNHEIFTAINETDVVRPGVHVPGIPKALERIALRCLQRDPADRYPDMDALASDLERFAAGSGVVVRLPGLIRRIHRRARRHPLPWALGTALLLVALGFFGYVSVQNLRRWTTWTTIATAHFDRDEMPDGMQAVDAALHPLAVSPIPVTGGLPAVTVDPDKATQKTWGWWWIERPGLRGGVRLELDLELPAFDTIEMVINAPLTSPTGWWHHPAGWAIKLQSAEQLSLSATYLAKPDVLPYNPSYLLERPASSGTAFHLTVEVIDTTMTFTVAGCKPVVISEPLALGGSEHRGIGLRWFAPETRLKRLRIERLAMAELVSPLVAPDALLRQGQREAALSAYRLLAADHPDSALGAQALLRAYAVSSSPTDFNATVQEDLFKEIRQRPDAGLHDQADRIRAQSLWSRGESSRAVGIAIDLVARRPDLNPILGFLVDRTWVVDQPCGNDILRLFAAAPTIGSIALADMGITDLAPLHGRRAWSVFVSGNEIRDLSPLSSSGCQSLIANQNRISDLRPLARLTTLRELNLSGNEISDLRPLAALTGMKTLNLSGNRLASLAGLPSNLNTLLLGSATYGNNDIRESHRSVARGGGNPIADLVGLKPDDLRVLSLAGIKVADLGILTAAKQLARLDLSLTPIRDLTPLRGLPITELSMNGCVQADLTSLDLPELRILYLRGVPRIEASVIDRHRRHLTFLDAGQSNLTAWPPVEAPKLAKLDLSGCKIGDLAGISQAPALRTLLLRGCGLRVVPQGLTGRPFEVLDLRDNQLTTLDDLLLEPAQGLKVIGNPLDDAACAELIQAGRRLNRHDLAWQGASILAARRGDLSVLKDVAVPCGRKRIAVYHSPGLIGPDEAKRLAEQAGGGLLVPADHVQHDLLLTAADIYDWPLWLGVSLLGGQVVDDRGAPAPFTVAIPAMAYRGYSSLPRDGGRLGQVNTGRWTICLDSLGSGLVIAWDQVW